MAKQRNPSGLPSDRIIGPIYGPPERDLDYEVSYRYDGLLRVRRSLFIVSVVIGVVAALVAVFGSTLSAAGIVAFMLAPLLVILVGTHLVAMASRPKDPRVP